MDTDVDVACPPLGITMGDAAGVGPEIVLAWYRQRRAPCRFVVIGELAVLDFCNTALAFGVTMYPVGTPADAEPGCFNVLDMKRLAPGDWVPGRISAQAGGAALGALRTAVDLARSRAIRAIVTLPMNKEATRLSTPDFTGHTEVIAQMCGSPGYTMMLASDALLVTHVSSHVSLRQAVDLVRRERIAEVIDLTAMAMRRMGRSKPIAVMGLNPHAGEAGAFGDEDDREIAPAVNRAVQNGMNIVGPLPPDTVFMRACKGEFGAVVCMYHDQGHIPMKTIGFEHTVNITVGLPIVRTSVDHGTALDIAYKGAASIGSFGKACDYAVQLSVGPEKKHL